MEINPVNKELLGPAGQVQQDSKKQSETIDPHDSVSFNKSLDQYIAFALTDTKSDAVDIEQIRRDMNAGQFDNPDAIRQAAENILNQGI